MLVGRSWGRGTGLKAGKVQDGFVVSWDREVAQMVESTKGQPGSLRPGT